MVVPEIWASAYVPMLKNLGFRVGVFVQNAYLTHVNLSPDSPNGVSDSYAMADLVLSISADSSRYLVDVLGVPADKVVVQRYSVDRRIFRPSIKEPLITFMPRKMSDHSSRVVSALNRFLLPGWRISALDQLNERQVAHAFSKSILFLAFSEFEGLPVPPVEAALSGNIVIGYHGQGGREYWQRPNFIEIEQGDFQRFIFEVSDTLSELSSGQLDLDALNAGISVLGDYFSVENEIEMLQSLIRSIQRVS